MPHTKTIRTRLRKQFLGTAVILLLAGGCVTEGGGSGGIDEVHLFGLPVALNIDNVPGPDAFSIRVYASASAHPRGVPIRSGTLEVVLYDGAHGPAQPLPEVPLRVWRFTPQQLKTLASENRLGTGYEFTLPWTGTPPTRSRVTVLARYRPPSGPVVVSGPSAISLTIR